VLQTLELSWGGLCTHVRDGWNVGKPPYGYRAKIYRHPNPAKAARGATKMRLEPDPAQAETVSQIAAWRYYNGMGYDAIAERLNADPERFPPPMPPGGPHRARGAWGKSSVYEILRNPKYTGYQVFNRRASRSRRGKVNDPAKWVWSLGPTHEPLIAKWMYDEFRARAEARRGSREDAATLNRHPQTRRSYLLRGRTHCWCGRRMNGTPRRNRRHPHGYTYYQCRPRANNRGRPDRYHPEVIYIREDALLEALARFYADRVFGPHRAAALAADLDTIDDRATTDRQAERERLQRKIADLTRRQANLRRQAQELDPGDPWAQGLRADHNALEEEKTAALAVVADLNTADAVEPARPHSDDVALLDALPYLRLNLTDAPQPLLRALFEATRLTINLHADSDDVTITVALPADNLPAITDAALNLPTQRLPQPTDQREGKAPLFEDAVRAPGGIRTHTERCLRAQPLPIGLRGRARRTLSRMSRQRPVRPVTIGGITVRQRGRPVF
jgi:site-specific DNA recombinase